VTVQPLRVRDLLPAHPWLLWHNILVFSLACSATGNIKVTAASRNSSFISQQPSANPKTVKSFVPYIETKEKENEFTAKCMMYVKLQIEQLNARHTSKRVSGLRRIIWEGYSACMGEMVNAYRILWTVKKVLMCDGWWCGLVFKIGCSSRFYEYGTESLGSMRVRDVIDQLSDSYFLKNVFLWG